MGRFSLKYPVFICIYCICRSWHTGGDPSVLNNYCLLFKLWTLAEILKSQVNLQLKQFLSHNNILLEFQSGLRSGHSTITAAMAVTNDLGASLDRKQHFLMCRSFKSLWFRGSWTILDSLRNADFGSKALKWFKNYLTGRAQCVEVEGHKSHFREITKCAPRFHFGSYFIFYLYK